MDSKHVEKTPSIKRHEVKSKEANQNDINNIFEENSQIRIRTSTPIQSSTSVSAARNIHANVSPVSNGSSANEHAAYKEYRDAGDYWK